MTLKYFSITVLRNLAICRPEAVFIVSQIYVAMLGIVLSDC